MDKVVLMDKAAFMKKMIGTNRYFSVVFDIEEAPEIDPESLPIVKELRDEINKLEKEISDREESSIREHNDLHCQKWIVIEKNEWSTTRICPVCGERLASLHGKAPICCAFCATSLED